VVDHTSGKAVPSRATRRRWRRLAGDLVLAVIAIVLYLTVLNGSLIP
jgi:hypothetical protein